MIALFGNFTEGAGKVLRHARLLGDDEGFGHEGMPSRPPWRGLQVGGTKSGLGKLNEIFAGQLFDQAHQL
jgi:hypothetical protein